MFFTHEFDTQLDEFGVGKTRKVWYRVIFLPPEFEGELPFDDYPRLRIDAEVGDVPVNGAWIPAGDGRRYLIVSPEVLKTANLAVGDNVTVRFRVADQDHVDVPVALEDAVTANAEATAVWDELTPGKRRALAHHVRSAKTEKTQSKRVAEAMAALVNNGGMLR